MKKILLIEDNKDLRENTAEILQLASYKVLTAKNGKEGVETAQKEIPDLIICDIMMPVLDGYGVLHLLSKNDTTNSIPFIFLSAKAERSDLRKGMDLGADDYLTKPFESAELLSAIESRLKRFDNSKKIYGKNLQGLNDFINNAKGLEDLKKISQSSDVREYRKKDIIYKEAGYPKGVYFLNKGKIKTYRTNEQGKELITGLYGEGDFFGYIAMLDEGQYEETATALEDSEVSVINKEDFNTLVYKNSEVSKSFIKMIADNLKEKEDQLVKLAYNSVRKRVAEALTTLYFRYGKDGDTKFTINIAREDLANLAGTATETTIRTLSDFKEERLIEILGSSITIVNLDKLSTLKN